MNITSVHVSEDSLINNLQRLISICEVASLALNNPRSYVTEDVSKALKERVVTVKKQLGFEERYVLVEKEKQ